MDLFYFNVCRRSMTVCYIVEKILFLDFKDNTPVRSPPLFLLGYRLLLIRWCQFVVLLPLWGLKSLKGGTVWFRRLTPPLPPPPWKMRERAWQFGAYWAAWHLKARNYVASHSAASLRSAERSDTYVRSLMANLEIYFRGRGGSDVSEKKRPKLKWQRLKKVFHLTFWKLTNLQQRPKHIHQSYPENIT